MHHRARPRDKGTGMRLFSRHHDDDYVSPFDVDDSPAYISIDSQTSQVDEPAYQQPKSSRISPDADRRRPAGKPAALSPADKPGGPARTGAGDAPLNLSYNGHPYRGGYGHVQSKSDRKPGGATKREHDPGLPSSP